MTGWQYKVVEGSIAFFVDLNACGLTERVYEFSSGMNVLFFLIDE